MSTELAKIRLRRRAAESEWMPAMDWAEQSSHDGTGDVKTPSFAPWRVAPSGNMSEGVGSIVGRLRVEA